MGILIELFCAKKRSLKDALAYIEYITTTIRSKELFHSVDMRFSQAWDYLMWLDPSNYGGVRSKPVRDEQMQTPGKRFGKFKKNDSLTQDIMEDENDENDPQNSELTHEEEDEAPDVEMQWNLATYLPIAGACQKNFNTVIVGYITSNYQYLQEEIGRIAPGMTPIRRRRTQSSQTQTPIRGKSDGQVTEEDVTLEKYSQELISGELAQRLFAITQKLHKKLPQEIGSNEDSVFPVLPGSYLKLTNPALEFVKALCRVLSLDPAIESQVNKLKRNLLRLIGVGEFSDAAEWKDPCLSFVLPEVICKQCNHCRDIDLCKDPFVTTDSNSVPVFVCSGADCRTPYDTSDIEHLLLDAVQRKTMGYVLQDLSCLKCNQVKATNMSKNCTCAGKFKTLQSTKDLIQLLRTFASVAQHYKMTLLTEVIGTILKMNNLNI